MKPEGNQEQEVIIDQEADIQTENLQVDDTATEAVVEPVEEISELDKTYGELTEMKDKYLRLYADFENFRRRMAKEKLDLIQTASEETIKALLPVWDDIERATPTFNADADTVDKVGVELIFNKFKNIMISKGVKPMEAKGTDFNVDLHESVTQFPAPTEDLKGKVIDEIERGYTLYEKVIRFAKVVVGM